MALCFPAVNGTSAFPGWAIAVIVTSVLLAGLLCVGLVALGYFLVRRDRKRSSPLAADVVDQLSSTIPTAQDPQLFYYGNTPQANECD